MKELGTGDLPRRQAGSGLVVVGLDAAVGMVESVVRGEELVGLAAETEKMAAAAVREEAVVRVAVVAAEPTVVDQALAAGATQSVYPFFPKYLLPANLAAWSRT